MIVAAHPDDEILGLGAAMNKWINSFGIQSRVIILGEGITSRADERNSEKWKEELIIHKKNISDAGKVIGYHSTGVFDFPDNRFDEIPLLNIIKSIEREKELFKPDVIFTHHGGDLNIDHQKTFEAVMTACRPIKNEGVKTIFTFQTPSSTEWASETQLRHFAPNFFVRVSEENVNAKIEAMECYQFEKRNYPHPRSPNALKILAQHTGIRVGFDYAEAFCLIRHVGD